MPGYYSTNLSRFGTLLPLAMACGILESLAFPPHCIWAVAWIAFSPLAYVAIREKSWRRVALFAAVTSGVFHLVVQDYIRTDWNASSSTFGVNGPFATLWICNVAWLALTWAIAASTLWLFCQRFSFGATFVFPAIWITVTSILMLFARTVVGFSIPELEDIALTQTHLPSLIQLADLVGAKGVSFVVLAANGLTVDMVIWLQRYRQSFPWTAFISFAALLAASIGYGTYRIDEGQQWISGPVVAMCRSDFANILRDNERTRANVKPGDNAAPKLFVLGENALITVTIPVSSGKLPLTAEEVTLLLEENPEVLASASEIARKLGAAVAVGTTIEVVDDNRQRMRTKTFVLATAKGDRPTLYHKINLSPHELPANMIQKWLHVGQLKYTPGTRHHTLDLTDSDGTTFCIAPGVCYDGWLSQFYWQMMRSASTTHPIDFFAFVSDESTDATGRLTEATLRLCQLRAVECRRSIVRNVTSGDSAIVDSCGRVLSRIGIEESFASPIRQAVVPIDHRTSPYSWLGNAPLLLFSAAWLLLPALLRFVPPHKSSNIISLRDCHG
jgi:apolipoprotein N-acyltransferase